MVKNVLCAVIVLLSISFTDALFTQCEALDKLFPVHEEDCDDSFKAFRKELLEAVMNKNVSFIKTILDSQVNLFYPDADKKIQKSGVEEFLKQWEPEKKSDLWDTLTTILFLGGSFIDEKKQIFEAPYVHSAWPESIQKTGRFAIIDNNVNLHEKPDTNSTVIAKLSYDIVVWKGNSKDEQWIEVVNPNDPNGKQGWVSEKYIRYYYDYSIRFEKVGNKWMIKIFAKKDRPKEYPPPG